MKGEENGKSVDAKDCILDVLLELNTGEIIDLEIQVRDEHNWPERSLLYWAKAYDRLKKGEDYERLKKTYHIGILDFTLFKDNPAFYAKYEIRDTKTGYPYTDKLNIRILDLAGIERAIGDESVNPKLIKWVMVFKAKTMKELETLAEGEEVFRTMVTHIKELTEDERIRMQCAAREDYERRMIGEYNRGTRDGEAIGVQKGETIGLQKGEAIGLQKGEAIGRKKAMNDIFNVINHLKSGNMTLAEASKKLNVPLEEVEKLLSIIE